MVWERRGRLGDMRTDLRGMGLWAEMVVSEATRSRRRIMVVVVVGGMVGDELSLALRFEEGRGKRCEGIYSPRFGSIE